MEPVSIRAPVETLASAPAIPDVVVWSEAAALRDDSQPSARDRVNAALQRVRGWPADERFARSRLVVVTGRAVALPDAAPDTASAAVWGLPCSAQTEYLERFRPRPRCRSRPRQATTTSAYRSLRVSRSAAMVPIGGGLNRQPCDCHSGRPVPTPTPVSEPGRQPRLADP
ncbi:SpnB-like Rossmann fold domain-containing protein [Nocardia vinacea]|uniref:SpnB-like Rossmann fold domain-containing protein n=1 Tax=Nocardia vinacea TaxID=96468 RepID=UPI003F4E3DAA